jgi:hypothetical protein
VRNAWTTTNAHAQGAYFGAVDGLTLSYNTFDHNGWREDKPGAEPDQFRHNCYVQVSCRNVTSRQNIYRDAANIGLSLRCGGVSSNDRFIRCPTSIQMGTDQPGYDSFTPSGMILSPVIFGSADILRRPYDGFEAAGISITNGLNVQIHDAVLMENDPKRGGATTNCFGIKFDTRAGKTTTACAVTGARFLDWTRTAGDADVCFIGQTQGCSVA